MGDPLKKVKRGDRLRIPAATYNAFIDTTVAFREQQLNRQGMGVPSTPAREIVLVKNNTGADQDRFAVLGVNAPLFLPGNNLDSFKNRLAMVGVVPTATHVGKFVVLLQPLKSGGIGQGLCSGTCQVRLTVPSGQETSLYADVTTGGTAGLTAVTQGAAYILWKENPASSGTMWALVRVGVPAPVLPPGILVIVQAVKDGGSSGNADENCSFTYTLHDPMTQTTLVRDPSTGTLATGMVPEKRRYQYMEYREGGGPALAYRDFNGCLHLWDANEIPLQNDCEGIQGSFY